MEVLVIVYLSSLDKLIDIIMKFVSLSAVVRFDDMYAAAMQEHVITKAAGTKLKVSFKRYMLFQQDQVPGSDQFDPSINNERSELLDG